MTSMYWMQWMDKSSKYVDVDLIGATNRGAKPVMKHACWLCPVLNASRSLLKPAFRLSSRADTIFTGMASTCVPITKLLRWWL